MKTVNFIWVLALGALILSGCNKDNDATLNLTLNNLEDLGADYVYEGWIMVNGSPVTTGTFTVSADGTPSQTAFIVDEEDLEAATAFVLSIEPTNDPDPAPSNTKILSGAFSANEANLAAGDQVGDFSSTVGKYILATPTTTDLTDELSGVWFLDLTSGSPAAGLTNLPTLSEGWAYEGWVVLGGVPVSTGTFRSAAGADDSALFSGAVAGPPFPGEDLVANAPSGLTFPTNLQGATVVVSIEPVPDNSANPFLLKPLVSQVAASAADHETFTMTNQATTNFPTGTASF